MWSFSRRMRLKTCNGQHQSLGTRLCLTVREAFAATTKVTQPAQTTVLIGRRVAKEER